VSTNERRVTSPTLVTSTGTPTTNPVIRLVRPATFEPPAAFGRELLAVLQAIHERQQADQFALEAA